MTNIAETSSLDLLKGSSSFSGGEKTSKKKPIPCPVCGQMLEYITVTGKSGRYWAHKNPGKCKEYFKNEEQIRKAQKDSNPEAQGESPIVEAQKETEDINEPSEPSDNASPDECEENSTAMTGQPESGDKTPIVEEGPPDEAASKRPKQKPKQAKVKKPEDAEKTTIEKPSTPASGIPVPITISLSDYESIGGDSASYNQLFRGIDKLLNNVARDAFAIVEDEPAPKVKTMKRLTKGSSALHKPQKEGGEKDLEKRAKVDNKKITITTAYSEAELRRKEQLNPSTEGDKSPFLIYNSSVYPLQKADKDKFTIGRADGNDLVIKDKTISSHHAVIKRYAGKYYISDISSNGTLLQTQTGKARVPKGMFMELTSNTNIILPHATIVFVC